jgi:hypothetical protein
MPKWTGKTGFDSANFLEMMPDTITFNATTATDKYGKKTFGGGNISVRCRLVDDTVLVKDSEGQDIVSVGRAYLAGDYSTLTLGHKITLPNGATPVIVKIDSKNDTSATVHHTVVHFGA